MKPVTARQRGVEHDIVQTPQVGEVSPYYEPQGNEVAVFEAAYKRRLPVMLKGPTGCGKTRFLEHMAFELKRPLVTVSCHEDLTSSDLVGRFLLEGADTVWQDGPLTRAVKAGAICYLDEIVEARTDSTVVIHSLTDHRRKLSMEKKGQEIDAHEDFMLVISYNPGYQTVLKDLKPSTKQRFIGLNFDFPSEEIERKILVNEVEGLSNELAQKLVAAGRKARLLKDHGLEEATSTRALVYAGSMITAGLEPVVACQVAMVNPITDDPELAEALMEIVNAHFAGVSSPAIRALLGAIREANAELVAEIEGVIPVIRPHGEQTTLDWINACRTLFDFDREAGRAFVRGSREAEKISESVLPWTRQALALSRFRHAWPAIEGYMKNLPRAFGSLGHAGEERWAEIGLTWCGRAIDSGCAYFTTPVLELSGRGGGIAAIEALNTPAEELFESRKLQLASYLPGAIRVRNLLGVQAVLPWALRGADIMQSGRTRGEAYFRLESEESLALLLENMQGYKLADRNRLLGILLEVWFGDGMELKESSWSPEKGRPFMETDGESLYFPAVMSNREEAIIAVLHAAGHMRHGTFDRAAMKRVFSEAKVEFPESGAVSWAPVLMKFGEDAMRFQLIFDLCEDLRIESRLQRQIPNYFQRLIACARANISRHPETAEYYALAVATAEDALRAARGEAVLDARFSRLYEPDSTLADAYTVAGRIFAENTLPRVTDGEAFTTAYLPGRSPNSSRVAHPQDNPDENSQSQPGEEQQNQPDEEGEDENDQPQESETGEQQEGAEQQESAGYGDNNGSARRAETKPDGQQQGRGPADKGVPYPEWDYRESRYKKNWSWVQEKHLGESNMAETHRLMKQYGNALKRLKKAVQSQKPTRMSPKVKQFDGDEIDLNAVIEYVSEKIAGRSPQPAIYKRREMRQREISVILLADMSTSIMQHLPEGGGRLVDRIRAGVLLFAESLEEVGDNYAIAGFCSKYRDNVAYYNIKDFDDPYSDDVRAQIGGMSGRLATRMGAAIRHATKCFERVESRRRLLLLLSDGRPEDYDDGGDRRYLHEDTRMAVKEAVAKGVHPFCITVDTMANQYLPQIFGAGHYMVLDQINSLPNKLPEIYLRLRR